MLPRGLRWQKSNGVEERFVGGSGHESVDAKNDQ